MSRFTTDALLDIMARSIIWAFVGLVFGSVFVPVHVLFTQWYDVLTSLVFAAAIAGTLGALVYSSLGLAVIASIIGCFSTITYLIVLATKIPPLYMIPGIALLGVIAGIIYGIKVNHSRVYQADAKGLAGFSAGVIAGIAVVGVKIFVISLPMHIAIATICLLTGLIYATVVNQFALRFQNLLPAPLAGALVSSSVAVFVSYIVWVVSIEFNPATTSDINQMTSTIIQLIPYAFFGAMLGGLIIGIIRTIYDVDWLDI